MAEMTEGRSETSRVEAFSDGVFAIAITLLVLDVRVPEELEHGHLWQALGHIWPSYAGYATSFFAIGIMWVNHHDLFAVIERVDRGLLYLNLAILGLVGFLPFPTAILARFLRAGGTDARAAAVVYGLNMVGIGTVWALTWRHLRRHPDLVVAEARNAPVQSFVFRYLGPLAYGMATVVGFIAPLASLAIFFATAMFFASGRMRSAKQPI